jgi:hypothetical protein
MPPVIDSAIGQKEGTDVERLGWVVDFEIHGPQGFDPPHEPRPPKGDVAARLDDGWEGQMIPKPVSGQVWSENPNPFQACDHFARIAARFRREREYKPGIDIAGVYDQYLSCCSFRVIECLGLQVPLSKGQLSLSINR